MKSQQSHSQCKDTIKERDLEHFLLKDNSPLCLSDNYSYIITQKDLTMAEKLTVKTVITVSATQEQ